ncbi:hypothetical protein Tco_0505262 [Tanacetum coccineum]
MRKGLKTHDRMKPWDVEPTIDVNSLCCSPCNAQPDSHTHLFIECAFAAKVWSYVYVLADMDLVPHVMHDIILHLQPMGNKRTASDNGNPTSANIKQALRQADLMSMGNLTRVSRHGKAEHELTTQSVR